MAISEYCSTLNNCVGYVYFWLGIIPEERYVEPPSYEDLLKVFEEVDIKDANSLAVIKYEGNRDPYVDHMALVMDGGKTIGHRKGVCREADSGDLKSELERYIYNDEFTQTEIVYLKPIKEKTGLS